MGIKMNFIIDKRNKDVELSTSRRSFITGSAALLGTFSVVPVSAIAFAKENSASVSNMQEIAQFLTGKTIDSSLAERAGIALTKIDPDFTVQLLQLAKFIHAGKISDIEALKVAPGFEGEVRSTAQKIISALYLGYAGDPVMLSSEDNVQFVTYTQAITYQLTEKYTPVPSYSRWGTGYWEHLPTNG